MQLISNQNVEIWDLSQRLLACPPPQLKISRSRSATFQASLCHPLQLYDHKVPEQWQEKEQLRLHRRGKIGTAKKTTDRTTISDSSFERRHEQNAHVVGTASAKIVSFETGTKFAVRHTERNQLSTGLTTLHRRHNPLGLSSQQSMHFFALQIPLQIYFEKFVPLSSFPELTSHSSFVGFSILPSHLFRELCSPFFRGSMCYTTGGTRVASLNFLKGTEEKNPRSAATA